MHRIFLKAKIHRARITAACLDYEGSLSIDRNLMLQADIAEHTNSIDKNIQKYLIRDKT